MFPFQSHIVIATCYHDEEPLVNIALSSRLARVARHFMQLVDERFLDGLPPSRANLALATLDRLASQLR